MEMALGILLGIGLSAACGLRVFVPVPIVIGLLVIGVGTVAAIWFGRRRKSAATSQP